MLTLSSQQTNTYTFTNSDDPDTYNLEKKFVQLIRTDRSTMHIWVEMKLHSFFR